MIKEIEFVDLDDCLLVIRKSFATVADEFHLTEQNAATNGAFMKMERLHRDFDNGVIMFGYFDANKIVGFMQLASKDKEVYEFQKLAVLPEYRHKAYGKKLIDFAKDKVMSDGGRKITIGIIEENKQLKEWYLKNGFVHTGTKKFEHLPFTVGFMELHLKGEIL